MPPAEEAEPRSADEGAVVLTHPQRSAAAIAAKRLIQGLFLVLVAPRLVSYWLSARVWGRNRAFLAASESISRIPGMRGVYARQAFYRVTLSHCGQDVYFGWQSVFSMTEASVGDNAYIGRRCGIGYGHIGPHAMLADGVQILSGGREHGLSSDPGQAHQGREQTYQSVTIGAGAWVGTNAVVMADVGEHTVVGAGAVVTRPLPCSVVASGVPAKTVRPLTGSKETTTGRRSGC